MWFTTIRTLEIRVGATILPMLRLTCTTTGAGVLPFGVLDMAGVGIVLGAGTVGVGGIPIGALATVGVATTAILAIDRTTEVITVETTPTTAPEEDTPML